MNFNGNDPIGLFKDGVLVDMLGVKGGADFAKDVILEEKLVQNYPMNRKAIATTRILKVQVVFKPSAVE